MEGLVLRHLGLAEGVLEVARVTPHAPRRPDGEEQADGLPLDGRAVAVGVVDALDQTEALDAEAGLLLFSRGAFLLVLAREGERDGAAHGVDGYALAEGLDI